VIQNDMGHESTGALDPKFTIKAPGEPNVEAIIDFGHRATHVATDVGKRLVSSYYGRAPQHAYWQGCSTGGRQGLAEIQRYPTDYDGVIAGAPVYTPLVYSNAILRVQAFHKKPDSNLLPEHVPLIQKHVLAACDAKDGVADGILTDPRSCTWDPGELACKGAPSADCLTQAQIETVRRVYAGVKTKDGQFAAMPLMRGGESDWINRMIGTKEQPLGLNSVLGAPFMSYIVKHDPSYDVMSFDPERDMKALSSGLAAEVHQQNPDISTFIGRGGKLLLWHGFNDPGSKSAVNDRVFRSSARESACGQREHASVSRARSAALRRRRGTGSIRRVDRDGTLGRAGNAARVDDRDQGELTDLAPALSVSAGREIQGNR
jgi:feruloyl esterase